MLRVVGTNTLRVARNAHDFLQQAEEFLMLVGMLMLPSVAMAVLATGGPNQHVISGTNRTGKVISQPN